MSLQLSNHFPSYPTHIFINTHLTPQLAHFCKSLARRFALITDHLVQKAHGERLLLELQTEGIDAELISFPGGEGSKTRKTKELIEDTLFAKGFARDSALLALGGGVVLDLAGFVAATYARGIALIFIPTTLLAMADASLGGKNGVDIPGGKNMIGTTYPPLAIFNDLQTLLSLPDKEMRNGAAEIIKHGLIHSMSLFEKMETHSKALLQRDFSYLQEILKESIAVKQEIVEKDLVEAGLRRVLNFGHTVGHAIESLHHYLLSHGEAIVSGMMIEAEMSVQRGLLQDEELRRMRALFKNYGFSLELPSSADTELLWTLMSRDKKSIQGRPRVVFLERIGKVAPYEEEYCAPIDRFEFETALNLSRRRLHAL